MKPEDEIMQLQAERGRLSSGIFSANTSKSYADSWQRFEKWCKSVGRAPLPATSETVALWATSMLRSGLRVTSVEARVSGVAHAHKMAALPSPWGDEVRWVLVGARRLRRERPDQKRALTIPQLIKMIRKIDTETARGVRDRAILVLAFAGAFRRSEVAALELHDVTFTREGLLVFLRYSKTDQVGRGRHVGIYRAEQEHEIVCPVRTLRAWLDLRGSQPGPLFHAIEPYDRITDRRLGRDAVPLIVKDAAERIGLDPHLYAGHSLRAGFCTSAAENGATEISIMQRTGHKSVQMVHRYVRPVSAFAVNPLAGIL